MTLFSSCFLLPMDLEDDFIPARWPFGLGVGVVNVDVKSQGYLLGFKLPTTTKNISTSYHWNFLQPYFQFKARYILSHVCFTLQIIITFPLTILIIKCLVCIAKPGGSLLVPWFAHTHTLKSDHINYILIRFEWSNTHNIVKFLCYFHIRSWHGLDFRPMGKRQTLDCGSPIFLWLRRFIVVYGVILGSNLSNLYPLTPLKDAHVTTSAW